MKRNALCGALALSFAAALAMAPVASQAADAAHPYRNIDKRVDAGNNTGDDRVEALNEAQLDQNYNPSGAGNPAMSAPMAPGASMGMPMPMDPSHPPMTAVPGGE